MKISEVIEALETIKNTNGDIPVVIDTFKGSIDSYKVKGFVITRSLDRVMITTNDYTEEEIDKLDEKYSKMEGKNNE